ncbi:MAG: phosphopyruvate hydratase [Nanoarchaeota archaeon]
MSKLLSLHAREILDSRGNPTIEVAATTQYGVVQAAVPSGASTGKYEACELRDGGKRYNGLGVLHAVKNVNQIIARKLKGVDVTKQVAIDQLLCKLDKTNDKHRLGANAILGVSLACAKAAALCNGIPIFKHVMSLSGAKKPLLPIPVFNVINGGAHAGNDLDFQEFMLIPVGAKTFGEALQMGAQTYHMLKNMLRESYGKTAINLGDEGGFAPQLKDHREPIKLLLAAIEHAGYDGKIKLGIDCAASQFYQKGLYHFEGRGVSSEALKNLYTDLVEEFPIVSLEDPFSEDDLDGFADLTQIIGKKCQVVGDDLLTTSVQRIHKAVQKRACNALLLKPNQVGTLTEALEAYQVASKANWKVMASHRSGETNDPFIAHLATGIGCGQLKAGALARGERVAKYNELLYLEECYHLRLASWR